MRSYTRTQLARLFLLGFLFLSAVFIRLYKLETLPYGLHEDEMMNGYVGRFILQNGKDLYGNRWPLLYFNNFGDYPPVVPMYLSGLFTYIFGITPFAVRFPIALAGSLSVFPMFFLLKMIFRRERYAYAGAFFLAILPWQIILSRATAENITAGFVHLCALLFLFKFLETKEIKHALGLTISQFSKYFLYASFRVTIPLSLGTALLFTKNKRTRITLVLLAILFAGITLLIGRTDWGRGRFKQTSIFYFNNTLAGRITKFGIEEGENHILQTKIFHNKLVVYSREFARQYLSYFSPTFLFMDGGLPHRYLMEDTGVLYISFAGILAIVFLLALAGKTPALHTLFTENGRERLTYLCIVLFLSPIPSALTLDDVPNVHRSAIVGLMMIFPLTFFFALLEKVQWRKVSIQSFFILTICVEFVYFWHQFSVHGPHIQSPFRGDDRTALAKYLIAHHAEYSQIYLPHDAKPLYYLFFSKNFDASLAGSFGPNISLDHVDNLHFTGTNCPTEERNIAPSEDILYIDRGECVQRDGFSVFAQIKRYDGSGSFRLSKKSVSKEDQNRELQNISKKMKTKKAKA